MEFGRPSRSLRDEDYIKETVDYLRRNMEKGYSLEELKWALINQGKSRVLVEKSVETIQKEQAQQNEIKAMQSKPVQQQIVQVLDEKDVQEQEHQRKKGFFLRIFG
ncbi:hypothetical protein COS75_02945 [Candidatus Pacearchaeota archaeon CG06_land_8_20_14_3_00_35_12]|nr:MAG: hypothetical protein COS75_02945 [Candidatus Pacearchaeota archaeon CG06_land_8_20_14_3_00_35_12]